MKHLSSLALLISAACLAGCASIPRTALLEPVGPGPALSSDASAQGALRVYSARENARVDLNGEEFLWNNDFGRNEFLHLASYTAYTIYSPQGEVVARVTNSRNPNDGKPELVTLAPGDYRVVAQAEDYNNVTFNAVVPVVIRAGAITRIYLTQDRQPATQPDKADVVYLPNGRIAGWRAVDSKTADTKANRRSEPRS